MPAYDNSAIAAKLELYADLLEISGADRYRFLAYRKAGTAIRAWPEQVAALVDEGHLTDIPGVGKKMAAIVENIVRTGTFDELEEASQRYPSSLASVMRIPGVGPKRAALLHDKLGIADIAQLENALEDGRVARLGGFGDKTAAKMAGALEAHRRHMERTPIADALPVAEQLVVDIRGLDPVATAEVAGSVRRRAETVRNIDVLVATSDADAARRGISELAAVERVIEEAADHAALELHDGMRVDVRHVDRDSFGAALVYWTGSKEVGTAIEQRLSEQGLRLGPDGLWRGDVVVPAAEEAAVFEVLGIPVMPPEARESAETLETAEAGRLPRLVTLADVRGDLQSHSTYTDGRGSLEQNRAMAASLEYEYIAVTDHAYQLRMVGGMAFSDIERQWEEIDELNSRGGGPRLLKGIELNIGEDGSLDYDDEVLARFEIVLASLHSGWDQEPAAVTRRVLKAIEHPLVDIIAHPTGRIIGRRDPLRIDMEEMLAAAGETGTIMEINSYPDRLDLSDEHIRLARRFGVRFSLGTDAHRPEHFRYMPYGVAQARRGLVSPEELLNAQPWDVARTWLKRTKTLS